MITDEQILEAALPFGAFEYGDAQGHKRIAFARAVLALAAPAPVAQGEPVAWIEEVIQTVELIADSEHSNGPTPGKVHRAVLRELLQKAAARMCDQPAPAPVAHLPDDFLDWARKRLTRERAELVGFIAIGNELHRAATYDRWIAALNAIPTPPCQSGAPKHRAIALADDLDEWALMETEQGKMLRTIPALEAEVERLRYAPAPVAQPMPEGRLIEVITATGMTPYHQARAVERACAEAWGIKLAEATGQEDQPAAGRPPAST
jgi:hypothetical protein